MFIHTLIEYSCWFTSYAMCSYSMRSFARGNIILGQLDCKMREAMPREQLNCAKGDKAFNVNKLCIYERSSSPLVCIFVTIESLNLYISHNNGLLSFKRISLPIYLVSFDRSRYFLVILYAAVSGEKCYVMSLVP